MLRDEPNEPLPGLVLAVLLLIIGAYWGERVNAPPPAEPATIAANAFSASRAMADVEHIARAPHPVGSAEHGRVRDYLMQRLETLGYQPRIQAAVGASGKYRIAGRVENILARLPGKASTGTILVTAHYDSVPTGPGAGDDGAGVAALLETAGILKNGPALKNDVLFLLADGEEMGLLGAEAFVHDPDFADVGLVLNFEARGSRGTSYLFETSAGNAELIRIAAGSTAPVIANSLTYEVYQRLPNDTDFSVYKRAGKPGLNSAFIAGLTDYHSEQDRPNRLSPDSLQHHGADMLGLTQAFGDVDLKSLSADHDLVYFPAPWRELLFYTPNFALGLALLALILSLLAHRHSTRHGLTGGAFAAALAVQLLFVGFAGLAGHGLWQGLKALNPPYHWLVNGEAYGSAWLCLAVIVLVLAAGATLAARWRGLGLATVWMCSLAGAAATWYLPGASPFLVWPALVGAIAILLGGSYPATILRGLLLGIATYLLYPLMTQLAVALTPAMLGAVAVLAALLAGLVAPIVGGLSRRIGLVPASLFALSLGLLLLALWTSRFDLQQKQPDHVMYFSDRSQDKAWWLAAGERSDDWMTQFLGTDPVAGAMPTLPYPWRNRLLQAPAPVLALPAPNLELIAQSEQDGQRRLVLRLASDAPLVGLEPETPARLVSWRSAGQELPPPAPALFFLGTPRQHWDLELTVAGPEPLKLHIIQQFYGLPGSPAHAARGPTQMTTPLRQADSRFSLDIREF